MFCDSIPRVLFVYILLKLVRHYDFTVLSISMMGFQKQSLDGWVGGVSSIQFFFGFFLTLQNPDIIVFLFIISRL